MLPSIPNFELIRPIGEGGFGEVWLARTVTGKLRAVKWVRRERFESPGLSPAGVEALFRLEFEGVEKFEDLAANVPELISILLVGWSEDKDAYFYVMPLADDLNETENVDNLDNYQPHTLESELERRGAFSWDDAVALVVNVGKGVTHLHRKELRHGDISPGNILFLDSEVVLADPGLTSLDDDTILARSPGYTDLEGVSDVFSLGRLFFHLVTGKHPMEVFPIVPREVQEDIPTARFATFLDRCCDPDRDQRFADASELVAFLDPKAIKSPLFGRVWVIGGALLALVLTIGWCWLIYDRLNPPPPAYAEVDDGRLSVFSEKNGRILWSKNLPGQLSEARVIDLDGDGSPEVLCAVEHLTSRSSGLLYVFSGDGKPLWQFNSTPDFQNFSGYEGQEMGLNGMIIADFHPQKTGQEIMLLSRNALDWFPTVLQFLDSSGTTYATYWHPGHLWIKNFRLIQSDPETSPLILFHGLNNRIGTPANEIPISRRKHTSVLALLEPSREGAHEAFPGTGKLKGKDSMTRWYRKITPQFGTVRYLKTEDQDGDEMLEIILTAVGHYAVVDEADHIHCDVILDLDGKVLEKRTGDGHRHAIDVIPVD